jgi:hypothetical protein
MKLKNLIPIGIVLWYGMEAFGQDRLESFDEYSYLRFNPTLGGLNSRNFNREAAVFN